MDYSTKYINLPWDQETKFLVIVNYYDNDVTWANKLKFPHVIYYKEKPYRQPFNAINKAKSETNLLKFISDFYDNLPENVINVHQYETRNTHHGSMVDILNDPHLETKYQESKTKGYLGISSYLFGADVHKHIKYMLKSGWWDNTMKPWFGEIDKYHNFTHGKKSCAQFIVSRERIHSLPREFYRNMYQWLVLNSYGGHIPAMNRRRIDVPDLNSHPNSDYFTSRYMEWSWELIFAAYKPTDKIDILYNGNEISALYGADSYLRDVTHHLIKYFIKDDELEIKSNMIFNNYFGDSVWGTPKKLIMKINDDEYIIDEVRKLDVKIPLLKINTTDRNIMNRESIPDKKLIEKETFGFIIIKNNGDMWMRCYQQIRKFYDDPILIINNDSEIGELINCQVIQSEYEASYAPYYYLYHLKPFDIAVIVQDSMFFQRKIYFKNFEGIVPLWSNELGSIIKYSFLKMANDKYDIFKNNNIQQGLEDISYKEFGSHNESLFGDINQYSKNNIEQYPISWINQ